MIDAVFCHPVGQRRIGSPVCILVAEATIILAQGFVGVEQGCAAPCKGFSYSEKSGAMEEIAPSPIVVYTEQRTQNPSQLPRGDQ